MKAFAPIALLALISAALVAADFTLSSGLDAEKAAAPQRQALVSQDKPTQPAPAPLSQKLTAQICTDMPTQADRRNCFTRFFAQQQPLEEASEALAIKDAWRINTRRLETDKTGRILIRSANIRATDAQAEGHAIQHIYAACRAGRHSLWLDLGEEIRGRNANIAVEFSFDGAPFLTTFFDASQKRTAVGVWQDGATRDLLQQLAQAKSVRVRPIHAEISQVPAEFDTTALAHALEPFKIACP
ncbi:hypothetical protein ACFQ14_08490 [Pseudahrensia aquimaris]|uniref:Invasion protein IalB, involved in pathogenesis n=1 Tax=Pseudahrensia aquimaris TaxID=744461 RepID=A0ABW3FD85_9HYPH